MKIIRLYSIVALLGLGVLPALAACGDDDDSGDNPAGTAGASGKAGSGGGAGTGGSGGGASGTGGSGGSAGSAGSGGGAGAGGGAGSAGAAGSGGGTGGPFEATGKTGGTNVAASAQVVVIWTVSSGSPDYSYTYGSGTSTGAQFVTQFGADPPAEAINSYGVGIGTVFALKPGFTLPEGKLDVDTDTVEANTLGVTPRHAIIWRDPARPGIGWSTAFPGGYACGQCVEAPQGETFDSYTPTECANVELLYSDDFESFDFCNWT
jgi:hypothetical protein